MNYKKQLENQLWLNKRNEILQRDKYRCCKCGSEINLQVHHKRYIDGRKAWEYDNSDLITLCNKCHYKEHHSEKPLKASVSPKNFIFYKSLIKNDNFKPSELILYSIFASIAFCNGCNVKKDWYEYNVDNVASLCKSLNITRQTFYRTKNDLIKKGLLTNESVYVPKSLTEKGYFRLYNYDKISGQLLIFYSFLKEKSKNYNNCIDTYKEGLSMQMNTTKIAITKLLNRLYALGLAERLDNGKLRIL